MDTPPSGGRTRTYGLRVDAEGPGSDTPESKGTSLILSHNGASGDTPESSGMIPKRSTSGAAQGETPDAVTTRLGMPKLAVAARQLHMPSTGFEASTPERPIKRSGQAQAAGTSLPAQTARAAVAKEALCTLRSLQPRAMEWAKAAGTSFSAREMADDAMSASVDSLGAALSDLDLQRALGMSADDFDKMSDLDVLTILRMKARGKSHNKSDFTRARAAYLAVTQWMENKAVDDRYREGVPGHILVQYFAEAREAGIARIERETGAHDAERASVLDIRAPAGGGTLPRKGKRKQTGHSCGMYHLRGIKFLVQEYGLNWAVEHVEMPHSIVGRADHIPQAAQTPTLRMIGELELFLQNEANSIVLRHLAAGYLFCCYASMRVEQAQNCWFDSVRDDEIVQGYVVLDKHPRRRSRQPRPFWVPVYGMTGSRKWLDTLWETLNGVRDKCFIFRAFLGFDRGVGADEAETFLPGPLLSGKGLVEALQLMLRVSCGLTVEESLAYTLHSPRHFMHEVAAFRGESEECRNELGRWSRSTAQQPHLRPLVNDVRAHSTRSGSLADLYATCAMIEKPIAILQRQMFSLRKLVETQGGVEHLPLHGGWKLLDAFPPNLGDA